MATTTVSPANSPDNNVDVTSGNTLDVQNGGTANATIVESGGTLQVDAGGAESGATIRAGGTETVIGTINSTNVVTAAATAGSDDDFGTINVGSGGAISGVIVENGGVLALTAKSASANNVTVKTGGTLTINGNAPANNVTLQGGVLDLISAKADTTNTASGVPTASGSLTFASGYNSKLQLDALQTGSNGTVFAQTINGFAAGDAVDLRAIAFSSAPTLTATQNSDGSSTVKVAIGSTSATETFTFANTTASGFTIASDNYTGPNGTTSPGTQIAYTVCFASGTAIRTMRGDVLVEQLAIGDLAVTASGDARPIRWIGRRTLDCRNHPRPSEVMPVRVAAHAFGENRPVRDLFVSPAHALAIDLVGEVLIPACRLINATTITQVDADHVTYWHVELESHDILLAENLPAESYIEMGNRAFFDANAIATSDAVPDAVVRTTADFCRPFHEAGVLVEAVRGQLRVQAERLGWRLQAQGLGDLHLLVDGRRVAPDVRGLTAGFAMPAGAREVWLVSTTSSPAAVTGLGDDRSLGICVGAITLGDGVRTTRLLADDPSLGEGFHAVERDGEASWRWTTGRALLPTQSWSGIEGEVELVVELVGEALPRWVKTEVSPLANYAILRLVA